MRIFSLYMDVLKNMLFPCRPICIICGKKDNAVYRHCVCTSCWSKLPFIQGRLCIECGKQLPADFEYDYCPDCISTQHFFDAARSVFYYTKQIKQLIFEYKFNKNRSLYLALSGFMADALQHIGWQDIHLIVPVPLHKHRLKQRGFNQSEWLAIGIYLYTGIKVADNVLVRYKNTLAQTSLKKKDRLSNVKNAFAIQYAHRICGKNILLIDDIYTTGATINECSRILKKQGAGKIYALTLATGININY